MHVGERIAAHRKRRGMSQEALAGLVGMSRTWLSQVERGLRGVDRLSTLTDLASVLRVEVNELIGKDWKLGPDVAPQVRALDAIRSQLAGYAHLLGADVDLWPLPQLRTAAVLVNREYQAANYASASAMLPDVLGAADALDAFSGDDSREIHLARCMVYTVTAKLLTKVGESHLAWLSADRAARAAMAADSTSAKAMAAYQVVTALLKGQQNDNAERIAVSTAESLMGRATSDRPDIVSLAGAHWLIGSVIAARRADRATAMQRLDQADGLSGVLAQDANHAWTAFGPTNTLIHRASVSAELGNHRGVLEAATLIDPDALPGGLNGRRSRLHLNLAWAQSQARHDLEATMHLLQAERVAPEVVRFDCVARELIRGLLKRSRRPAPALNKLAARSGVLA
ncbi:helix-turn-helix transcriptional regulator [Terrabacter koreensis]